MLIVRPFEDLQSIFGLLIPSTLVLVSVLVGLGIAVFVATREQRQNMLSRFVYLQDEFQKYREAFYWLATQLTNRYYLDLQCKRTYENLCADIEFWHDATKKPYATVFVRALNDVGEHCYEVGDYESRGVLVEPEVLQMAEDRLADLSGTLDRRKHYKHIFSDLSIDFSDDFDSVYIAEGYMKAHAEKLPYAPDDDWRTLGFWQNAIDRALGLVEKILPLVPFIFHYRPRLIRRLGMEVVALSVFGVLIPFIGTILQLPEKTGTVLALASAIGFLVSLALIIVTVYRYISTRSISRPISKTPV